MENCCSDDGGRSAVGGGGIHHNNHQTGGGATANESVEAFFRSRAYRGIFAQIERWLEGGFVRLRDKKLIIWNLLLPSADLEIDKVLAYLDNKRKVHRDAVRFCENVLLRKSLESKPLLRNNPMKPIRDVEMVITIASDGTLLQASHFMDDSIPVLGVNSDPTVPEEVEELRNEFDATRSTGYLCAANVGNFELYIEQPQSGTFTPGDDYEPEWAEYKIKETSMFAVEKYQQVVILILGLK